MSQPSERGPTKDDAAASIEAFKDAESRLAAGNEGRDAGALKDLSAIENQEATAQPSTPSGSDALTEGILSKAEADEEVKRALDDKAREERIETADDAARIVTDLTPHNL